MFYFYVLAHLESVRWTFLAQRGELCAESSGVFGEVGGGGGRVGVSGEAGAGVGGGGEAAGFAGEVWGWGGGDGEAAGGDASGEALEEVGDRIKRGLSYRELLAALLLAGVRNVQPRPQVGFKFHAVLVVNSAHLASLASPAEDRWLPIFWALDHFKSAQTRR